MCVVCPKIYSSFSPQPSFVKIIAYVFLSKNKKFNEIFDQNYFYNIYNNNNSRIICYNISKLTGSPYRFFIHLKQFIFNHKPINTHRNLSLRDTHHEDNMIIVKKNKLHIHIALDNNFYITFESTHNDIEKYFLKLGIKCCNNNYHNYTSMFCLHRVKTYIVVLQFQNVINQILSRWAVPNTKIYNMFDIGQFTLILKKITQMTSIRHLIDETLLPQSTGER
ncbi:hypothetical protein AGLY_005637 [Aphis glycines]|uniref:Uncharacterized protein n=1 Tax=Aphis glycines TaxID=307491 RepID=A0A6G0TTS9_APHGL|nr:hypothetical protein AGLY_005637 [Aphis glycines]